MNDSVQFPHVGIRASAGSGKTYKLTSRYLGLLLSGEKPEQILATTFTRKAAGEILERVVTRLAKAVLDSSACKQLGADVLSREIGQAEAGEALLAVAASLHRTRISTIDSFFSKIATCFSFELGLPMQWEIVDESEALSMQSAAIDATLRADRDSVLSTIRVLAKGRYSRSIASLVRRTVDTIFGAYLITHRTAWEWLAQYPDPDPDVVSQLIEELESAGKMPFPDKRMGPALAKNIASAKSGNFQEFVEGGFAKKVLEGSNLYQRKPIPEAITVLLTELIEQARFAVLRELHERNVATFALLSEYEKHLSRQKQYRAGMQFDDITRTLAQEQWLGRMDDIYFRLDGTIRHMLLDEFQDTSVTQWTVLSRIAKEIVDTGDTGRSILLVGDVKQAIYGWRGGEAGILDSVGKEFASLEWEHLHQSRRSAPPVIDAVNKVFEGISTNSALRDDYSAASAWQDGFHTHVTVQKHLDGYVRLEVAPDVESDDASDTVIQHAAAITKEWTEKFPTATIGVLTRTNDAVGKVMAQLRDLHVPASEEGGNPITDSAAVAILLSLLTLADHPGDSAARFHVASSPLGEKLGLENREQRVSGGEARS
ncbi:MAG: UvrD-helicase domain-containing protein [Polyangiaceae bacterium]|nr:UvrD-helicase domain-containing protein [Polyangiaceae bacterium]